MSTIETDIEVRVITHTNGDVTLVEPHISDEQAAQLAEFTGAEIAAALAARADAQAAAQAAAIPLPEPAAPKPLPDLPPIVDATTGFIPQETPETVAAPTSSAADILAAPPAPPVTFTEGDTAETETPTS